MGGWLWKYYVNRYHEVWVGCGRRKPNMQMSTGVELRNNSRKTNKVNGVRMEENRNYYIHLNS
jgi:hypothetical protein